MGNRAWKGQFACFVAIIPLVFHLPTSATITATQLLLIYRKLNSNAVMQNRSTVGKVLSPILKRVPSLAVLMVVKTICYNERRLKCEELNGRCRQLMLKGTVCSDEENLSKSFHLHSQSRLWNVNLISFNSIAELHNRSDGDEKVFEIKRNNFVVIRCHRRGQHKAVVNTFRLRNCIVYGWVNYLSEGSLCVQSEFLWWK